MSRHSRYLRTFSQSRGHFKFLAQRPLFGTFENPVWIDQTEFQSPRNIKRDTEDLMGGNECLVRSHTHTLISWMEVRKRIKTYIYSRYIRMLGL